MQTARTAYTAFGKLVDLEIGVIDVRPERGGADALPVRRRTGAMRVGETIGDIGQFYDRIRKAAAEEDYVKAKPQIHGLRRELSEKEGELLAVVSVDQVIQAVPLQYRVIVLWAMPFVAGHAAAAGAEVAGPYIDRGAKAYGDWTLGGRGGFKPGELVY